MAAVARKISISALPSWVPVSFLGRERKADRNKGGKIIRINFRFSRPERTVYRKRKYVSPSKWAEKHRYVTSGPLSGGRWSGNLTHYLVGMMDASFFPSVREIYNCKSPQGGGTVMLETCLGYAADRRPGPAIVVYPDSHTARENCKDNLQTMIKSSPRLASLMTGVDDDLASLRIRLTTMLIKMGWSGSAASLGNKSAMYLVLDEVDKYTDTPNKKEAGTIDNAKKRVISYQYDSKIWMNGTPTVESGNIWQALIKDAQVIFEYWGKCPFCGGMQHIRFGTKGTPGGIKWPGGEKDYGKIENERLAWYECEHCFQAWNDQMRNRAVRHGEWRAKNDGRELFKYLQDERPKKIGFHTPAWISPFVSISESAARFIKGQTDRLALKDFCNNYAAEPWTEFIGKERRIEAIQALRSENAIDGVVPSWALCLLLTADVQKHGIWYELRAWDERKTSQLIRHGYLAKFGEQDDDFALLKQVAEEQYFTADKREYMVRFCLIDSGYRTDEVYDFCRANQRFVPSKGYETRVSPVTYTKIDTYPGTGRLIQGGVVLVNVDTNFFKDTLASRLQVNICDPGAWILHKTTDDGYCRQYTSEIKDEETGLWMQRGNQANHLWDCGVLQLVALDIVEKRGELGKLASAREMAVQMSPRPQANLPATPPPQRPQLW